MSKDLIKYLLNLTFQRLLSEVNKIKADHQ